MSQKVTKIPSYIRIAKTAYDIWLEKPGKFITYDEIIETLKGEFASLNKYGIKQVCSQNFANAFVYEDEGINLAYENIDDLLEEIEIVERFQGMSLEEKGRGGKERK